MEALKLTREIYEEGLDQIGNAVQNDKAYLDQFEIEFPEGLNTASSLEICKVIQDSGFESKVHIMRLCIAGKNVVVKCPNGEVEKFRLGTPEDSFDGIELFKKDPLALWAIADSVYGYLLKKFVRPSQSARAEVVAQA